MIATQMSLTPTSFRRWNQMGKKQKKVVCRSATVDARLNQSSYWPYWVCRWTASSTPQLWRRSMLPAEWNPNLCPGTMCWIWGRNLGCAGVWLVFSGAKGCQPDGQDRLSRSDSCSVDPCAPHWTLLKAREFVCLQNTTDTFPNHYTTEAPPGKSHRQTAAVIPDFNESFILAMKISDYCSHWVQVVCY